MKEYVTLSIETHLFFARIMKEHALFLLAAFPSKEANLALRADHFREEFECGLKKAVALANGIVRKPVLDSCEIVTAFTQTAECQTHNLTGIPINTDITSAEMRLCCNAPVRMDRGAIREVRMLNRQMLRMVSGLIAFKEEVLQKVLSCRLYTANYPLLIEHILREARLYRQILMQLERGGRIFLPDLRDLEIFWNQIMMEHAQFIRGLLDPTECELIQAADGFAGDFCRLLEEAKAQELKELDTLTAKALKTTKQYQQFKSTGAEGITGCQIRSVILPLLADHVLREANHYLRILEYGQKGRDCYGFM